MPLPSKKTLIRSFEDLRCSANPSHGGYDFICTNPGRDCKKLICADCLKSSDPHHFQRHHKHFIRFNEFIDLMTGLEMSKQDLIKLKIVKGTEDKLSDICRNYDRYVSKEKLRIDQFFSKIEKVWSKIIRVYLSHLCSITTACFEVRTEMNKEESLGIWENCTRIIDFSENLHLKELEGAIQTSLKEGTSMLELVINDLLRINSNFEGSIDSLTGKINSYGADLERDIRPSAFPELERVKTIAKQTQQDLIQELKRMVCHFETGLKVTSKSESKFESPGNIETAKMLRKPASFTTATNHPMTVEKKINEDNSFTLDGPNYAGEYNIPSIRGSIGTDNEELKRVTDPLFSVKKSIEYYEEQELREVETGSFKDPLTFNPKLYNGRYSLHKSRPSPGQESQYSEKDNIDLSMGSVGDIDNLEESYADIKSQENQLRALELDISNYEDSLINKSQRYSDRKFNAKSSQIVIDST